MTDEIDDNGQPLSKALGWNRIKDSRMDELIGICRGILADGVVVIEEAQFLHDWLIRNEPVRYTLAGKMLFKLLCQVLADNKLSADEELLVVDMLAKIIGGTPLDTQDASYSTTLPLDDPQPSLVFPDRSFCFTGKFNFGTREQCAKITLSAGAEIHKAPKRSTNYVVIGEIGSRDWLHSTGGRKIEQAISLREKDTGISIISECHWCEQVKKVL